MSTLTSLNKKNIKKQFNFIFNKPCCYNYSNYAFPLFEFIYKLSNCLKKNNVKNVFFLSREGQFLKKLFDEYSSFFKFNINSHYLMVSRNSVIVARLKPINEENFKEFSASKKLSIFKFLKTLCFDDGEIDCVKADFVNNFYLEVENFLNSSEMELLKNNKKFLSIYENKRLEQNKNFNKYLQSFNVDFVKEGLTIVDVGWKGTMQDSLNSFFNCKIKIDGYYLGNTSNNLENLNMNKYGLLYTENLNYRPTFSEKIYKYRIINYEQILRADHNRVLKYCLKNNKIECVLDNQINDKIIFDNYIKLIQSEIFDKFKEICEVVNENKIDISNYSSIANEFYVKMLKNTNLKDLKLLYNCLYNHFDSFLVIDYERKSNFTKFFIRYKLSVLVFLIKKFFKRL